MNTSHPFLKQLNNTIINSLETKSFNNKIDVHTNLKKQATNTPFSKLNKYSIYDSLDDNECLKEDDTDDQHVSSGKKKLANKFIHKLIINSQMKQMESKNKTNSVSSLCLYFIFERW